MTDYREMADTLLRGVAPIAPSVPVAAILAKPTVTAVAQSAKNLFDRGAQAAQGVSPDPTVDSGPILSDVLNVALGATPGAQEGAAGVFGGRLSKTANQGMLRYAKLLAENGADKGFIWNKTGWFQGADKIWRNEISDLAAKWAQSPDVINRYSQGLDKTPTKLGDLLDHPGLYAAYPWLRDTSVVTEHSGAYGASYGGRIGLDASQKPNDMLQTLLHEIQHEIQNKEGFARGGNQIGAPIQIARAINSALPDTNTSDLVNRVFNVDPYKLYRHLAGETESRNVETRQYFSQGSRERVPPWETQDIPTESQIPLGQILSNSLSK